MPVPEGYRYLPQSKSMLDAFVIPAQDHYTIGKTVEELKNVSFEKIANAAADFFTSGIAYLANNGHDAYIQEIGTVAWWAVDQNQALPLLTDNMEDAAIRLGVPPEVVLALPDINDEPHIFYGIKREGIQNQEIAYLLIPPEFVVKAQTDPIGTLGTMSWICSQVRDMANSRIRIDNDYIIPRADATEAHFLLEAVRRHPEVQLSEESKDLLSLYPEGIYSSNIPKSAVYKGITGREFLFARNN